MSEFNPMEVPIGYTLNIAQVNLILKGLGKLPREESEGFYDQFRDVAVKALDLARQPVNEEGEVNV